MLIVGMLYNAEECKEVERIAKCFVVAKRFQHIGHKALMQSKLNKLKNIKEV